MLLAIGIEVPAGGLEVGSRAHPSLVNVKRVFAGGQILNVQFDLHAGIGRRNCRGSNALALSILKIDGHGFGRSSRLAGQRRGNSKGQKSNAN